MSNPWYPLGHQPGVHVPGSTVPIQYAVDMAALRPPAPQAHPPRPETPEEAAKRLAEEAQYAEYCSGWKEAVQAEFDALTGVARLVQVMRSTVWGGSVLSPIQCSLAEVVGLLPEYDFTVGLDLNDPPWDDNEVARWFATHCVTSPSRFRVGQRRTVFGGWKDEFADGWVFDQGSTVIWQHPGGDRWRLSCGVAADGRRLHGKPGYGGVGFERTVPDDRFNARTLATMAELAGLNPLPLHPPA